jgi:thymidylate synthase (FAD)
MKLDVLDKGYVRLVDTLGNDLSVVNAARVSFDKESDQFSARDDRLLKFLWTRNESAPFRHAALTFEVYAPLMVARQWWKYAVASTHVDDQNGWNESSRRYVTEEPTFYVPSKWEWRGTPEHKKQGSGENLDRLSGDTMTSLLEDYIKRGEELYAHAMEVGVAAEQARLFLPAYGMYVRWRWTVSLAGVIHFITERAEHKAQYEIQQYAQAVREHVRQTFPQVSANTFDLRTDEQS